MNFKLTKSSLNFKVYTSPTIPSSGTENDIVIISTTPMENWILSSDAPVGEPRNSGDVWIQYSVSGNVFDIMNQHDFMLAITKVYQYVGKTWMSVNARRYVGGVWDVVSSAFSATISITYPANSTCTVTNPSGQIVANDTNATSSPQTFTATVNATGTYTVTATATDGSGNTKSQSVEITAEGQSVSVTLSYELILYAAGDSNAKWSTYKDGLGSVTFENTQVKLYALAQGSYGKAYIYYKEPIKGGSYSSLSITSGTTVSRGISGITKVCIVEKSKLSTVIATNSGSGGVAEVAISSAKGTYSLDLSGLSPDNEYYVMAWARGRNLGEDTAIQPSTLTIAHMILN